MELNTNCATNVTKGRNQFICKISTFAPEVTTRETHYFKDGDAIENSFESTITILDRKDSSGCSLFVGINPTTSNSLEIISATVKFVNAKRISGDFNLGLDDGRRDDEVWRNNWFVELHGYEALFRILDGLVEIIIQITVKDIPVLLEPNETPILNRLQEFGNPFDVLIEAEGQIFPSHWAVLQAVSPVFRQMVQSRTREFLENQIQIDGVRADTMSKFLQYTYTSDSDHFGSGCTNELMDLYMLADRYKMDDLKADCETLLTPKLTGINAMEVLDYDELYSARNRRAIFKEGRRIKTVLRRCSSFVHCAPAAKCGYCHTD